ncbi:serine/threonine protein kinase [Penicillium argentinense]|uniref:Serine/threonine protein kinase n=1 Tax=Penicillium argentinense TaxID=1131581 RepID=A0A9W9G377_9EURO|nr:serine/threonine protein kinase [Penicillium argentinense]KAJ5110825.1 serine/threonine protein kinase [Penicillium argentinense]
MQSEAFESVDLSSFESESADSDYSFVGLSLGTQASESSHVYPKDFDDPAKGIDIEHFFEMCFDSGIQVYPETRFTKGRFLGSGATMAVYEGTWKETGRPVALKYFKNALINGGGTARSSAQEQEHRRLLEAGMLELRVLSDNYARHHDNIVTLQAVSWVVQQGSIYPILITDLACKGHPTLAGLIKNGMPPLGLRYELIRDVVEGLRVVHEMRVVYGDIKPENILIFPSKSPTSRLTAKLSDFGFCQANDKSQLEAGGTLYWNAPECLDGAPADLKKHAYTTSRDIYALGLLMTYLLSGEKPFGAISKEQIVEMKLGNQVSRLVTSKVGNVIPESGASSISQDLLRITSQAVMINPKDRPSLREIYDVLLPHTRTRPPLRKFDHGWIAKGSILNPRFPRFLSGTASIDPLSQLDASTPKELRQLLYEHVLNVAHHGGPVDQAKAMERLGMFFLTAFGTAKSLRNAFTWLCRAAEKGSSTGMDMVFRLEQATQHTPMPLVASITTETRAHWGTTCLLRWTTSHYDPRLCPEAIDINTIDSHFDQALKSIDSDVLLGALQEDVESNIIALGLQKRNNSGALDKVLQHARHLARNSPHLQSIVDAVCDDDERSLDHLLQQKKPLPSGFLNLLVTISADWHRRDVLKCLVLKHGADPDTLDTTNGGETTRLIDAALRDDYPTAMILVYCGANVSRLMGFRIMDNIVTGCSSTMMRFALRNFLSFKVQSYRGDLQDNSSLCHQFLDGVWPSFLGVRSSMPQHCNETDIPGDSTQLPSLFNAVSMNSLDKLQALLMSGADPNIRFRGLSPIHLAVRMLRPTAVLLLLEFGANPNLFNSREGYITPLHALSQDYLIIPNRMLEESNSRADYAGRKWNTDKYGQKGLMQRRAVIIHLLLHYGADPAVCCVDGFTPLMMSMISPAPDSDSVFSLLVKGGLTLNDRTTRGETIMHVAVRMRDISWIERILSIAEPELINCRDNLLSTPLFLASQDEGSTDVLQLLLSHGAQASLRGMLNLSCLDVAILEGNSRNVKVLLDHITNIPLFQRRQILIAKDIWGRTFFHNCLASNDFELACTCIRRILSIDRYFSYQLLTSHEYAGPTPIDHARRVGNETALNEIVRNILPINFRHIRVQSPTPRRNPEPTPDEDPMLSSFKTYQSLQKLLNEPDHDDISRCYDAPEFSFPQKALSDVEQEWETCVKEWQKTDGYQSRKVALAMNYLGTATERHGRLKKAQDIFYRGWTLTRSLLGDRDVLTQDFACKFLRVSRDRGVDEDVCAEIKGWHKLHGRNTLKSSRFAFYQSVEDLEELAASGLNIDSIQDKVSRQCDRPKCDKRAKFACEGCNFVHYCSEACRVADMTDPLVQHHLACIRADPISSSLAIQRISKSPVHSTYRSFAQQIWNSVRKQLPLAPEILPPLKSFFILALGEEEKLTTPIHMPLEENLVLYWRQSPHEIRYSMHQNSPWFPCTEGRQFTSFAPGTLCIRPARGKKGLSSGDPNDLTLGWGFVVDYSLMDLDRACFGDKHF